MSDQKEVAAKEFLCPNSSCGKVFTRPLKAVNVLQDSVVEYNACPYCLTKMSESLFNDDSKPEEPSETAVKEKSDGTFNNSNCHHHLGYLSERSQSDQIPEECIVCKSILECMLKKMKSKN